LSQALVAVSSQRGESNPLQQNLFRAVGLDTALILVELVVVLAVVVLDDRDLVVSQTWKPADDLIVGAPVQEVRDQVVDGNPARRELDPSATIHGSNLFLHTISVRAFFAQENSC
jgi:hypothetical protein